MKIENLRATVRHAVLSSLILALVLMAAGCNGLYGTQGGGLPSIASVSPTSGPVGTSVTIYGTNFGASQGTSTVKFNGTAATPASWSTTSIVAPVPAGATTGNAVVTVGGTASNGITFTVNQAPASITATTGTPQSATINTAFATQLQVTVKDSLNNPVSGVTVTFTAPASGASGTFAGGVNTALTNASGVATAPLFTANGTAGGPYTVTATVTGVATPANFSLTNLTGPAASIAATAGTPQSTAISTAFATQLQATVKDAGNNPVSGVTVTFTAPASGASGTFAGSVNTALTNASGVATAPVFTANSTAGGPYTVTATVTGVTSPANFSLTNLATPPASITATTGTPQSTTINTAFATQLQATVKDSLNNPVSGVTVTFTAPASGASGTFAGGVNTALTNASGVATAPLFTANGTAGGPYTVTATVTGVATPANFSLTNLASPPAITNVSPASGPVGTPVTITGTNFGATQGSSAVTFNGTAATPTSWSATSVMAPVPAGAMTGSVVVTVGGVASNGVTFTVSSSGSKFPIKASANGRYFIDATGAPWIMVGDSAHHIVNVLPMSSWPTYFASRQSLGFNTVNIFSCAHGNCPSTGATADGQPPFTGMITSTCSGTSRMDYDLATPNLLYWAELDSFVNMAASYGQVVLFDPLTTADYMNDMRASGPTKAFNFGVYLGTRYKNFPNIIWELGNDFQTWTNTTPTCPGTVSDNTLVQQLMAGIASADTNHIQTIQLDYFRSYSNQDALIVPYIKADGVYTYYETYDYSLKAYNSSPSSPVFLTEANMEGANNTGQLSSLANGLVLRRQMYWMMTSGASGHVWGNTHVNHSDLTSPTWQSQLNTPATLQVALLTNLFTKYQWWLLVPDQTHQIVTAGFGNYAAGNENLYNSTYATTAWITNGSLAIVYTPVATTLTVNMANFSGTSVTAQWYDPTNGTFTAITGSPFPNTGSQMFTTPGTNNAGDPDWVLVLQ